MKSLISEVRKELSEVVKKIPSKKITQAAISVEQLTNSVANCEVVCETPKATIYDISYLESRINSLYQSIDRLWMELYEHKSDGHFPEIESVEQMSRILNILGLDSEYDVQKKTIYATTDGKPTKSWLEISSK